jgi:uncharacterized membrane protein YhiD involved in acid resistance
MHTRFLQSTVLLSAAALVMAGCESTSSSGGEGIYSRNAASAGSSLARGATLGAGDTRVASAQVQAVAMANITVLAKRQASERQRKLAEERARKFQAKLTPEKKAVMKKKKVRYIAIDTEKDQRTVPKAQKTVMIWDVETQQIVGNNVYDVEATPSVGQTAMFETYAAQYVGTGS